MDSVWPLISPAGSPAATQRRQDAPAADMVVQSGAPAYWCHPQYPGGHCGLNEWFQPLLIKRHASRTRMVPLLNLGVGSCQKYHSNGSEFLRCSECTEYTHRRRALHSLATVTTVRDKLAQQILKSLGLDAPLLPCPSIFLSDQFRVEPAPPRVRVSQLYAGGRAQVSYPGSPGPGIA